MKNYLEIAESEDIGYLIYSVTELLLQRNFLAKQVILTNDGFKDFTDRIEVLEKEIKKRLFLD